VEKVLCLNLTDVANTRSKISYKKQQSSTSAYIGNISKLEQIIRYTLYQSYLTHTSKY